MCMTIYLLADRKLPAPPDGTAYPGLWLCRMADSQAAVLAGVRRITPAPFIYAVHPDGYCGCSRTDRGVRLRGRTGGSNVALPDQRREVVRPLLVRPRGRGTDHVRGVRRLRREKEPAGAAVPPSYFGGPGFESLPLDLILTIIPESDATALGGPRAGAIRMRSRAVMTPPRVWRALPPTANVWSPEPET